MLRKPFYGWYIVASAFLSFFVAASTGGFTFSIFLPAMNADLGWSRSTIVAASSITAITSSLASPWIGRIVDQRGPRLVYALSILGLAVALTIAGFATEPWQFYLTFGLMSGIARSSLQSVIPGAMIANWFVRRRSAAYGVVAMGPPLCNFLLPPVITAIVSGAGWRWGWFALGALPLLLGLIPALFIVRRSPRDLGLEPDGDPPRDAAASLASVAAGVEDWTASEAVHSPAFWMVAAGMALILLAPNISVVFMFSYFSSKGMSASASAATISAVSGLQVLSRLFFWAPVINWLGSVRRVVLVWGSLLLCSSLLLALAQNEYWTYAAAGVLGVGLGGNLVLQLQIWPEYFGRSEIGAIIGWAQLLQGFASAVFPLLLAALVDRTGSYTTLYFTVAGLVAIGLLLHAKVGKPSRPMNAAA